MSDELDRPEEATPQPASLNPGSKLSRRRLIETGGALAAGASLSELIGAGAASAASTSPFVPFNINMKGTASQLEAALVKAADKGSPAESAILTEALTSLVMNNPAKGGEGFDFTLSFGLQWVSD